MSARGVWKRGKVLGDELEKRDAPALLYERKRERYRSDENYQGCYGRARRLAVRCYHWELVATSEYDMITR